MKTIKLFAATVITASALGLAACSSTSDKPADLEVVNASQAAGGSNVQTAGLGADGQFNSNDPMAAKLGLSRNTIYFGFDSSNVANEYRDVVQANAQYLRAHPNARVRLEGNTDPRGSREYNVGLGNRRSQQVADSLLALGIPAEQLVTVSYGQERPALLGNTEEAYRADRRVDIVYEVS
ncbi:MAG: peptidoglycan-associated lipoprotein [Legionellales bacterium]|nr:peptidoglycan-associated lipoprotein [Legionellales bacterium]|tara:strand:+ start:1812 stop:2351 length:540 start_codon:yes stop_codon:yes gene_type:complete